mmetsp:Transcript_73801/g.240391  ORF Transcript_73801/g.240391 Transcript_73801/m.240391 type:complete len:337 (+) Transcript_73801:518-1528(+)
MKRPTTVGGMTAVITLATSSHPERVMMLKRVSIVRPMDPNHVLTSSARSPQWWAFCPTSEVRSVASRKLRMSNTAPTHSTVVKAEAQPRAMARSSGSTRKSRSTRNARLSRSTESRSSAVDEASSPLRRRKGKPRSAHPSKTNPKSNLLQGSPQKPEHPEHPESQSRNKNSRVKNATNTNSAAVYAPDLSADVPVSSLRSPSKSTSRWNRWFTFSSRPSFSKVSARRPSRSSPSSACSPVPAPRMPASACRPIQFGVPSPSSPRSVSKPMSRAFAHRTKATRPLKHRPCVMGGHQQHPHRMAGVSSEGSRPMPMSKGWYSALAEDAKPRPGRLLRA